MCVLPFITPSVEPNGDVRLCSAASTYAYLDQTNMGNCRVAGLGAVWTNDRFKDIRRSLLDGEGLKAFCEACEYRSEGPPWMLQFHLALYGYNQTGSVEFAPVIERYQHRYGEYAAMAGSLGLWTEELPAVFRSQASWFYRVKAGVGARIDFTGEGHWVDATVPLYPFPLHDLCSAQGGSIEVRCKSSGLREAAEANLRVSIEDDEGPVVYSFRQLDLSRGMLSCPVGSLQSAAGAVGIRRALLLRVGGFGPLGASLVLEDVEIAFGEHVPELVALRARNAELEAKLAPLRRLSDRLPAWLSRLAKRAWRALT